ncbi:unnamed protein product [Adineta ricciae]|uniref:Uncharacterized protein n=1 Tax=Adineta ricciae TaxID=249248 RepID=A0A815LMP0_ADIRI|nr:unnamed protein product [Adineta ricciae]CAF1538433.1 unnamed protein product [Adineta ricciae]
MYSYSYKVIKRRLIRQARRQSLHHALASPKSSTDDYSTDENPESTNMEVYSLKSRDNSDIPYSSSTDQIDEDNWISDDECQEEKRPIYTGSSIMLSSAVRLINDFYLNNNLDKQTVNNLLRLIKSLLPQPNLLPPTWKGINKLLHYTPLTSTTFLCGDCYEACETSGSSSKKCFNPRCKTSKEQNTPEIVEIVRFDIRAQIQSIMNRNISLLNQSHLFPLSDICFGEQYQEVKNNNNRITLVVHSDGAPLVRSSKKSIWPCFASISELPPPVREFQKNIIILAIWTSRKKPNVNIFLEQTIDDLICLKKNGTSIFIANSEYQIQLATQFFVSDLPAKALFCCTTNFNGYSACTYCASRGIWSAEYNKVLYPYANNDLTTRTHSGYLKAAQEALHKSNGKKEVAVDGIKGLSSLLQIFNYPKQIIYDFMHLVCLGHIPYVINRWCLNMGKETILEIDNDLRQLRIPHNMRVVFLESFKMASQWKAKNSRLFVLHVGVPVLVNRLPILLFSHFIVYSLAIKLLHAPTTKAEISLAERLLHFYCRTASNVYDRSIEIFSLHAHIHLPYQVRQHGGLAHMSAFAFESAIRYIQKKAHGYTNLASQIGYWIDIQRATQSHVFDLPRPHLIDKLHGNDPTVLRYLSIIQQLLPTTTSVDIQTVCFYKRYKSMFVTYHTSLYDLPFNSNSHVISFVETAESNVVQYANVILFISQNDKDLVFVQKYLSAQRQISSYVELPNELHDPINRYFPILSLSNNFGIIPVSNIRHKCIAVPVSKSFSVVKSKQCASADVDGCVMVQSGGKKYMGFIFETGTFEKCSKAADLLSQKQHEDIESDYERKEKSSNVNDSKPSEAKTFTTLKDVPFSIDPVPNNFDQFSCEPPVLNSNDTNVSTPIRPQKAVDNSRKTAAISTTPMASIVAETNSSAVIGKNSNRESIRNSPDSPLAANSRKRTFDDSSPSPPSRSKKKKSKKGRESHITSSESESDYNGITKTVDEIRTPIFNGRRLITPAAASSPIANSIDKDSLLRAIETKYLTPLLVGQERLEKMMKSLYKNQVEIQKALKKRQMLVSIEEPGTPGENGTDFSSTLSYKTHATDKSIDLLKIPGTKEKANLYVTNLIQIMYTMDELAELQPADTYEDYRYQLIKEAVRSKFRLNGDQLEQMFTDWLREVFLAKRRVAVSKLKRSQQSE